MEILCRLQGETHQPKRPPRAPDRGAWAAVLAAVSSPLVFFALALLIVEASVTVVVAGSGLDEGRKLAGIGINAFLFLVVVGLTFRLAVTHPETLVFGETGYLELHRMKDRSVKLLDQVVDERVERQPSAGSALEQGAKAPPLLASTNERVIVLRRAQRLLPILQGSRILWVDNEPARNTLEREWLESVGITVEIAATSSRARALLQTRSFDAMISDIWRVERDEGVKFLRELNEPQPRPWAPRWTIFYTMDFDPLQGVPAHALGITNRPDHLFHYVMDAIERERS